MWPRPHLHLRAVVEGLEVPEHFAVGTQLAQFVPHGFAPHRVVGFANINKHQVGALALFTSALAQHAQGQDKLRAAPFGTEPPLVVWRPALSLQEGEHAAR